MGKKNSEDYVRGSNKGAKGSGSKATGKRHTRLDIIAVEHSKYLSCHIKFQ